MSSATTGLRILWKGESRISSPPLRSNRGPRRRRTRAVTNSRATYGYRRVWALVNRTFRTGYNRKRIRRVIQFHGLMLAPRVHRRHGRPHLGQIQQPASNQRWCSDFGSPFCQRPPCRILEAIDFLRLSLLAAILLYPAQAMDEKPRRVAVWLHDDHARLIVGAAPATKPSRWAIEGTIVETITVGLWVRTHTIYEFRPFAVGVKQVNWQFASTELLIRWEAVITIQVFESSGTDIGFKPTAEI